MYCVLCVQFFYFIRESLGHMRLELRRGLEEVRLTDSSTMSVPLLTNLARTFTERVSLM